MKTVENLSGKTVLIHDEEIPSQLDVIDCTEFRFDIVSGVVYSDSTSLAGL